MDIDTILREFGIEGRFPKAAVTASLEAPAETAPVFVSIVERASDPAGLDEREERALFLIVHVLAEMSETRAYRPLLRFLASDGLHVPWLLGDATTETLPQILIALFDGHVAPLVALIENEEADEFVRNSAFTAWTYLVLEGTIDRAAAHRYLLEFDAPPRPPPGNFVWNGWATAITALGFDDLLPLVRQACEDERIDPLDSDFDDFETEFKRARTTDRELWMAEENLLPFRDTIGRLSSWAGFKPREDVDAWNDSDDLEDFGFGDDLLRPVVNPFRDVGRNDPCPCGSGKKFKKCCLQ